MSNKTQIILTVLMILLWLFSVYSIFIMDMPQVLE